MINKYFEGAQKQVEWKTRHKNVHILRFHLYEIQEQAKLMNGDMWEQ